MLFKNVCIESVSYCLPENIITSKEIEERLRPLYERFKLPFGRLEMMSGIRERRFWDKGVYPSEISSQAGNIAIEKSQINRKMIECLICASVCRDFLEPATASVIHHNLKLPETTYFFDISNACLGVLNGMMVVANMIEMGQIGAGLIVSGENGGPLIENTIETLLSNPDITKTDMKLAFASLTIGSGAAGILLVHKDLSKMSHRLLGGGNQCATQYNNLCRGNTDSGIHSDATPLMKTDSEALMNQGIELAQHTWEVTKEELDWTDNSVDRIFTHQVGNMHRKLMYKALGLDMKKDFSTLEFLGNTGSAALPITLAIGEEEGWIQKGHSVGLLGIGSGLNCLMLGVEW